MAEEQTADTFRTVQRVKLPLATEEHPVSTVEPRDGLHKLLSFLLAADVDYRSTVMLAPNNAGLSYIAIETGIMVSQNIPLAMQTNILQAPRNERGTIVLINQKPWCSGLIQKPFAVAFP